MPEILNRSEIDDERWNKCVLSDPEYRHYPLTYYLDSTCEWVGVVGSNYKWVWPLPIKRLPLKKVYQPLLTQQLGPYGSIDQKELIETLEFLQQNFSALHIKFNDRFLKTQLPNSITHRNVELVIEKDEAAVRSQYNRNVLSNLKKAKTAGVEIQWQTEYDGWAVDEFSTGRGKAIRELNKQFYQHVKSIYSSFERSGQSRVYTATVNQDVVAQVLLLRVQNRLLHFFSASNKIGKKVGAMHAILDHIIIDHKEGDMILDFEGSDDDNLAFFYKSFGGEEKRYPEFSSSKLDLIKRIWK